MGDVRPESPGDRPGDPAEDGLRGAKLAKVITIVKKNRPIVKSIKSRAQVIANQQSKLTHEPIFTTCEFEAEIYNWKAKPSGDMMIEFSVPWQQRDEAAKLLDAYGANLKLAIRAVDFKELKKEQRAD